MCVMTVARHVDDNERRARLARRHGLADRLADPVAVTRAMTVLHATEPATVHLAVLARSSAALADVDAALYDDRSLVKQLAMRRTLFVFPRALLPAVWGSASARVAGQQRRRLVKEVVLAGLAADGDAWLDRAVSAVTSVLADGTSHTAQELRLQLDELSGRVVRSPGKKYEANASIAPNVLTLMGASALIVRGENAGQWRISRPRWTSMSSWLGSVPAPSSEAEGYTELIRRYLHTFGPVTEADIVWWLGSTKAVVRRALATLCAVPVSLDGGISGWLLPDDLDPVSSTEPWAALLPALDPTTMGWKERDFYLDPDLKPYIFDAVGNGGPTAWVDGRIVGTWVQDEAGVLSVLPALPLSASESGLLDVEAARLTELLDGQVVNSIYKTALAKGL